MERIGYVSQEFTLYGTLTVEENLDFFARLYRVPPPTRAARKAELLAWSRLAPFASRPAAKLSGGMQKKLHLSCTLIHEPDALFLDEPTTGVDPVSWRELWEILHDLAVRGLTLVVATPHMDEAEQCARVARDARRAGRCLRYARRASSRRPGAGLGRATGRGPDPRSPGGRAFPRTHPRDARPDPRSRGRGPRGICGSPPGRGARDRNAPGDAVDGGRVRVARREQRRDAPSARRFHGRCRASRRRRAGGPARTPHPAVRRLRRGRGSRALRPPR